MSKCNPSIPFHFMTVYIFRQEDGWPQSLLSLSLLVAKLYLSSFILDSQGKTGYVSYILFPKDLLRRKSTGISDPITWMGLFHLPNYVNDSGSFWQMNAMPLLGERQWATLCLNLNEDTKPLPSPKTKIPSTVHRCGSHPRKGLLHHCSLMFIWILNFM
jgi:hypothetical protein